MPAVAEAVKKAAGSSVKYVEQTEQFGTGHAVFSAQEHLQHMKGRSLLVLAADQPLIRTATMRAVLEIHQKSNATITLATVVVPSFNGEFIAFYKYGRVVRDTKDKIVKIVEFKECTTAEKNIREVNISCIAFDLPWLLQKIGELQKHGTTNEYHLMDLVPRALQEDERVESYLIPDPREGLGVNTPEELTLAHSYVKTL